MQAALRALNRLVADGVIGNYAIGGAIGASFYIDALQTEDIDAFVILPVALSGLVSLTPIYQALLALGGTEEREYIRFGEWPLQILTDANPLIAEAIRDAEQSEFDGVATRVFLPEHLCAIALQTGRLKDYLRVTMFLEQGHVDLEVLRSLAERYELTTQLARALREAGGNRDGDR
jgi:hypothetical protein